MKTQTKQTLEEVLEHVTQNLEGTFPYGFEAHEDRFLYVMSAVKEVHGEEIVESYMRRYQEVSRRFDSR